MVRNLIFDFGGVLINLDLEAVPRGLRNFGIEHADPDLIHLSQLYEKGMLSSETFLKRVQEALYGSELAEVKRIWNQTIADFPMERLEFLEGLRSSGHYQMYLLSNTNALHIDQVRETMGEEVYKRFHDCFHGFYLSHEVGMRKPDPEIFKFVLKENRLNPPETLFIDDTEEHTQSASQLGIRTWHFKVGSEDIRQLRDKLS